MGLLARLVMLPLAPVEGVVWIARQLEEQAAEELYGPDSIRRQLAELEGMLDDGHITETEFVEAEDELLDRLDEALRPDPSWTDPDGQSRRVERGSEP
ncbi:MAG: gas vesicle protein GvpG [Actinomycetota bacterium]|nr:gas vesicle protein GvpG [Actinomycetota bacterium]